MFSRGCVQLWHYTCVESTLLSCEQCSGQPHPRPYERSTVFFQVLATSSCNSIDLISQSESRIQILLQFDWMAWFLLLQPDGCCKNLEIR